VDYSTAIFCVQQIGHRLPPIGCNHIQ